MIINPYASGTDDKLEQLLKKYFNNEKTREECKGDSCAIRRRPVLKSVGEIVDAICKSSKGEIVYVIACTESDAMKILEIARKTIDIHERVVRVVTN
jgi:hypothetical protein